MRAGMPDADMGHGGYACRHSMHGLLPFRVTLSSVSSTSRVPPTASRAHTPVKPSLPGQAPGGIALFDLDGTLLAWDCQLLFRHYVCRREPWRLLLLPVFLITLPFAGLLGKDRMKRVFLSFLWRIPPDRAAAYARDFANDLMPAIYPELKARLDEHRSRGHLLVLTSASPEMYVREIGANLGFDVSLGTEVTVGRLLPRLVNHKGSAKVTRLRAILPPSWFCDGKILNSHGYSDSSADLPMLGLCESVTVVNPSPKLESIAVEAGWEIVRPGRPWKNRAEFTIRLLALLFGIGRNPAGIPRGH